MKEETENKEHESEELDTNEDEEPLENNLEESLEEQETEIQSEDFSESEQETEVSQIPETEKPTAKTKTELFSQIRALLNDYPNEIRFKGFQDEDDIINNLILVYDLLNFCKYKTNDKKLMIVIEKELKSINNNINMNELRDAYLKSKTASLGKSLMKRKVSLMLSSKHNYIADRIQYYSLAIPRKGQKSMHLKTTHGFSPSIGTDYIESEIEEGMKVDPSKPFKLNEEGQVIQVE